MKERIKLRNISLDYKPEDFVLIDIEAPNKIELFIGLGRLFAQYKIPQKATCSKQHTFDDS